jgi:hypothetical protein
MIGPNVRLYLLNNVKVKGQLCLYCKHHTEEIQVSIGKDIIQPAGGYDYNIRMTDFM